MTRRSEEEDPFGPIVREIQRGINTDLNYSRLYSHFHPRLWRHFIWRGMAPEAAEDLCQDVLFNAFRNLGRFEGRSWFAHWLYEIAHNTYLNELRLWDAEKRKGRAIPLVEEHPLEEDDPRERAAALRAPGPSPYEKAEYRQQAAKLREALEKLSPQQRNCIYLRVYQGLSYSEIAEVMKVSLDTVKAHLGKAKARLR